MNTRYSITLDDDGNGVLTVLEDGNLFTVTSEEKAKFAIYLDAAMQGKSLSEIEQAAPQIAALEELSERVQVNDSRILFDGEEVHDSLAKTIQRYWMEGRPYGGLVRFMERLSLNSNEHSRKSLWDWVKDRDLEVDNQGFLIAYKGVADDMKSKTAGWAFVDDVRVDGRIPNQVGSIISMPRSEVQHNPAVGCSTGLHVGTKSYAEGFGSTLLTVRVDPVDIVSVPTDCGWQKMRTCRYEVIDVHQPQKDYEPTPADTTGFQEVEERLTEAAPTDAQSFIQAMLGRIRGKR